MQDWKDFLMENYEITPSEYEELDLYMKHIIDSEYDEMVKHFVG